MGWFNDMFRKKNMEIVSEEMGEEPVSGESIIEEIGEIDLGEEVVILEEPIEVVENVKDPLDNGFELSDEKLIEPVEIPTVSLSTTEPIEDVVTEDELELEDVECLLEVWLNGRQVTGFECIVNENNTGYSISKGQHTTLIQPFVTSGVNIIIKCGGDEFYLTKPRIQYNDGAFVIIK